MRQEHRRIGSPVAVVPAVERARGPVDGDVGAHDAPYPEDDLRSSRLMDRTVAKIQPSEDRSDACRRSIASR